MIIIAPLWIILLVYAFTHPVKALKYGLAFVFGAVIGLLILTFIVTANGG